MFYYNFTIKVAVIGEFVQVLELHCPCVELY